MLSTQYLLVARCQLDEIPLGIFDSEEDAIAFAEQVNLEAVNYAADKAYGVDVSIVHNLWLVEFVDGKPINGKLISEFAEVA